MNHIKELAQHISTTFLGISVDKVMECLESFKEPVGIPLVIGNKYVPISKGIGGILDNCDGWNEVKDTDKPYLYLRSIDYSVVFLSAIKDSDTYFSFRTSDLIPYVELVSERDYTGVMFKYKLGNRYISGVIGVCQRDTYIIHLSEGGSCYMLHNLIKDNFTTRFWIELKEINK